MQLRAHVETDHIRNSLHKCYVCDLTFLSHRLLQEHISTSHCKKKIHCLYCDFVSDNMINLNTHTKNEHTVQVKISNKVPDDIPVFNWYDDFICQLDGGGDDLPVTFDSPSYNLFPAASSAPSGSNNLRKASYTLDRKKQIKKLKKDTLLSDFEIVVSPTETNINISPFPDSNNETSSASSPRKEECFPSSHNVMNTSLPSNNAVCAEDSTDAHADASIITIDEYMPNISSEENLNCQDPTIQF